MQFTKDFELATGPNGNQYVRDVRDHGRIISIDCFLNSNFNPWTAAEKNALRAALADDEGELAGIQSLAGRV